MSTIVVVLFILAFALGYGYVLVLVRKGVNVNSGSCGLPLPMEKDANVIVAGESADVALTPAVVERAGSPRPECIKPMKKCKDETQIVADELNDMLDDLGIKREEKHVEHLSEDQKTRDSVSSEELPTSTRTKVLLNNFTVISDDLPKTAEGRPLAEPPCFNYDAFMRNKLTPDRKLDFIFAGDPVLKTRFRDAQQRESCYGTTFCGQRTWKRKKKTQTTFSNKNFTATYIRS